MPWSLRMLLVFTVVGLLFQLYVARKTVKAVAAVSGWPQKHLRITAAVVILWFIVYPLLMVGSYLFKADSVPRALQSSNALLDVFVIYPFWIGIILAVQLALLFIVIDAAGLALYPVYKAHKARWLRTESWLIVVLVCVGAIYVVARVYNDLFNVRVRQTELRVANLPRELEGFRIVQVADLQADGRTIDGKLDNYIAAINQLQPDLVLFAGDLVTSGTGYIEAGAEALGKAQSRHGVYACLGDHDYFSDPRMVARNLNDNGVTVLENVATVVPVGSTFISLTGVTNVYRQRPAPGVLEQIEQQRPRAPINIFLTHQPSIDMVRYAADQGYDLFLAGHTHGGQIVFPLPGFLLTGSSFETNYVSGFYKVGSMLVSINNGLGLTLAPVRYNAPAEVTLISLKQAN